MALGSNGSDLGPLIPLRSGDQHYLTHLSTCLLVEPDVRPRQDCQPEHWTKLKSAPTLPWTLPLAF